MLRGVNVGSRYAEIVNDMISWHIKTATYRWRRFTMKKKLATVFACMMILFLVGCNTESTNRQNEILVVGVNDFDEDLFINAMGRHHFSTGDFVDVSLNWHGDGRVIFLSSTSELSENNIYELIESGIFIDTTEIDGFVTAGAIRIINDKETMLEFAYSSNSEINWRINFLDNGDSIYSYGYRYFYVITNESYNVSNLNGQIAFSSH